MKFRIKTEDKNGEKRYTPQVNTPFTPSTSCVWHNILNYDNIYYIDIACAQRYRHKKEADKCIEGYKQQVKNCS